jgi:hypothetical protein
MGVSLHGLPRKLITELRTLQDLYHEKILPDWRINLDCDPTNQESAAHSSSESDAGDSATRRADIRQAASHPAVRSPTREPSSVKPRSTEATTGDAPFQETQQFLDEYANSSERKTNLDPSNYLHPFHRIASSATCIPMASTNLSRPRWVNQA